MDNTGLAEHLIMHWRIVEKTFSGENVYRMFFYVVDEIDPYSPTPENV